MYLLPSDESLVSRSPVIAFGRVVAAAPGPERERFTTDLVFQIENLLKGFVPGSRITVRRPGGVRPDGMIGEIMGLPALIEGDRVLLFLRPDREAGVYRTVELGLGMFFEESRGNRTFLQREPALEIRSRAGEEPTGTRQPLRDAQRFRQWVADRASGLNRSADYFEDGTGDNPPAIVSPFRLTRTPGQCERDGVPVRWREFDERLDVLLTVAADGQDGLPNGGLAQLRTAIRAWNGDPRSHSRLVLHGTSSTAFRADDPDGVNSITFEDPHDEILGSYPESNVLALNWVFFYCDHSTEPHSIPGNRSTRALALAETNITTQDGYRDWLASVGDPRRAHEEIMAHELGHALGIAHTCGDSTSGPCDSTLKEQAIMRAIAHADGRGASLNSDDLAAVRFLYPEADSPSRGPAAPTGLGVTALSQSEIEVRWRDRSDNESAFEVHERSIDGEFRLLRTLGRDTTSLVVAGLPAATYRAYRVLARNAHGSSVPTLEAGTTTLAEIEECIEDGQTLCLNSGRFRVAVAWESLREEGPGRATAMTNDTGYFWFFDPDNVEIVTKVLDGCDIDGHFWIYAAGMTDMETVLTVSDSETGRAATYYNPIGRTFTTVQDHQAFAICP
ncbi:MAG: hypothetical protein OXF63_09820 [Anaerolineaceae bacterium]|nr:hypothetical protein [Anaerolineaceae bacterium]